ncbi:MAG: STAS domain-containing protein [Chitinispirillaceae bacterium]|nr:STAS domain-containing protein [Chitinispirillaceae bacterium]
MPARERGTTHTLTMPRHYSGPLVKEVVAEISRLNESAAFKELILDFSETELLDSSGIGVLVSMAKEFHQRRIKLILKNLNDDLFQFFTHTGLDRIFTIERQETVVQAAVDIFEPSIDIRLNIEKEFVGDIAIFHLSGVMNHPIGSGYFKQQFLLTLAQYKRILLDIEELAFVDSLSLSSVLSMNNLLSGTGGSMRICQANYVVLDLLETLKIGAIIPLFPSREEALSGWTGDNG